MQAFDALAPDYDSAFTGTAIARYLRGRVHRRLETRFQMGDSVLELGCGTGEDALYLARRGVRVLAADASQAMLDAARAKTADEPLVTVARLDLRTLPLFVQTNGETFDGIFSNFGPLNCLDGWRGLASWLAARIKPGGIAAFGVISPLCLWEIGWHGLHGDFRLAARRLRKGTTFQPDGAQAMPIHYPSIRRLERDFAPYFRRIHVEGLGLFLPPSDVYGVIEKRPRLLKTLMSLEQHFAGYGALSLFADHYWIEFERR
jgi:SAM-dependent methyltransferase